MMEFLILIIWSALVSIFWTGLFLYVSWKEYGYFDVITKTTAITLFLAILSASMIILYIIGAW